jgi:hypothetical protein
MIAVPGLLDGIMNQCPVVSRQTEMSDLPSPSKSPKVTSPKADKATACGFPAALSEMLIEAVRGPDAVGVKVIAIAHAAPVASVPPVTPVGQVEVFENAKSAASAPLRVMLVMLSTAVPALLSVTV